MPPDRPVLLAYDRAAESGDAAAGDVFPQMDAIEAALRGDGLRTRRFGVGLDLGAARREVLDSALVFNLVESLDGVDRLQTAFAMMLEEWGTPFTGAGSAAMLLSNDKPLSKRLLTQCRLPVADACRIAARGGIEWFPPDAARPGDRPGRWIVKPVAAHASVGIADGSVVAARTADELRDAISEAGRRCGTECFAERYVEGREFNVSLIEEEGGVRVLPPAELVFVGFPEGKPRIAGYAAKWDESSGEYQNTVRSFSFADAEPDLAAELGVLSRSAWEALMLRGYARVDFRVDSAGRPWILEVNANPCLAPDAGFAASAAREGWDFSEMCRRIVRAAGGV